MKTGFLETTPGNFSSTRLMFVLGLCWAIVMTTIGLLTLKWTPGEAIAFFTASSAVFVGLKLGQKPMEKSSASPEPETSGA